MADTAGLAWRFGRVLGLRGKVVAEAGSCAGGVASFVPEAAAQTGAALQVQARPDAAEFAGLRALVADDNPINLQIIDAFLKRMGVDTVLVDNGRAAVAAWAPDRFDILCLDIAMPELDGVSALREINRRAGASGTPPTPAVAITANAMSHQVAEYLSAGFDAHLAKPVRRVELAALVTRLTGRTAG